MSLTGLRAFHLVAQAGSFTKAARAGHVSQPTISAQVRLLEDAHGARLFDRHGRGRVADAARPQRSSRSPRACSRPRRRRDALLSGVRSA